MDCCNRTLIKDCSIYIQFAVLGVCRLYSAWSRTPRFRTYQGKNCEGKMEAMKRSGVTILVIWIYVHLIDFSNSLSGKIGLEEVSYNLNGDLYQAGLFQHLYPKEGRYRRGLGYRMKCIPQYIKRCWSYRGRRFCVIVSSKNNCYALDK